MSQSDSFTNFFTTLLFGPQLPPMDEPTQKALLLSLERIEKAQRAPAWMSSLSFRRGDNPETFVRQMRLFFVYYGIGGEDARFAEFVVRCEVEEGAEAAAIYNGVKAAKGGWAAFEKGFAERYAMPDPPRLLGLD